MVSFGGLLESANERLNERPALSPLDHPFPPDSFGSGRELLPIDHLPGDSALRGKNAAGVMLIQARGQIRCLTDIVTAIGKAVQDVTVV